jgi:type 1 glutamine amidotransferase
MLALALVNAIALPAAQRVVRFIAGEPSHGPGEHRFPEGCELLAQALNASGLAIRAEVSRGWPAEGDNDALARADTLVIYSDGLGRHVANDHVAALRRHVAAGRGVAVLHFALEAAPGDLADFLLEVVGGRFEVNWSVNPVWTIPQPFLADHSVTRGVKPFTIEDEWYFHLRFRSEAIPVLRTLPPASALGDDGPRSGNPDVRAELARGEPQTLAWVCEAGGARGFGFTGGHFHRNWTHPDFRKLVLNAIVWTAGIDVPEAGVSSEVSPLPRYATIDEAIARDDLADVRLHLAANPDVARRGQNASLTPLHQAILRNRTAIALALLDAGADPNLPDGSRRTPLHLAVVRSNLELVRALLARKATSNQLDQLGWTPLHHAAARDQVEIARALLAAGADPKQLSELGGTPLHEAAASGGEEMVRLLLNAGVDPSVVSKMGVTALDIARGRSNQAAIAILESR